MIVLKKSHYIAALVVLALVVFFAARGGVQPEPAQAAGTSSLTSASAVPQPEETAAGTEPAAEGAAAQAEDEPLVGVWIPYMSLSTAEKTEDAFKENYDAKLESARESGANAVFVHVRPFIGNGE